MRCVSAISIALAIVAIASSGTVSATTIHKLHKMQRFDGATAVKAAAAQENPMQCLGNLSAAWYTGVMGAHAWMEAATQDCVNKTKMEEDPHACQAEIIKGAARLTEAAADIRKLVVACNRSNSKCGRDLKAVGTAVQNIASDALEVWLSCKKSIKNIKELDACLVPLFNMTSEATSVKKSLLAAVQNCGEQSSSIDVEKKTVFGA